MSKGILGGRYEIIEKIGEGGMAIVFKGYDRSLDRYVAVKILKPEYLEEESFKESFFRESRLVSGINDPNIVQVYDVGNQGNIYYFVMELIEGRPLSLIIQKKGRLDAYMTVSYAKDIARALEKAHAYGLIHRDVKPHNIMVTKEGIAKLGDFGIAKKIDPDTKSSEKEAIFGSIHYFSPEQARGEQVDGRSDIYSLGIVMYEMITGTVPFDGDNPVDVAVKHMNDEFPKPSAIVHDMPQDLEDIILKCTAKSPADRYQSAQELLMSLELIKFSKLVPYDPGHTAEPDAPKANPTKKKKKGRKSPAILVAIVMLLYPLGGAAYDIIADVIQGTEQTISVPEILGYSYEEAAEILAAKNLHIEVEAQVEDDAYTGAGIVVHQSPSYGSIIKEGQTIKVYVSRAQSDILIPEISGLTLEQAKESLNASGLSVGTVSEIFHAEIADGKVISSNPAQNTYVQAGSAVDLVVSKGEDPENSKKINIDLTGLSLEDAQALIDKYNCIIKSITYRTADDFPDIAPGCVIYQSPSASEKVAPGTSFTLVLKKNTGSYAHISIDISLLSDGEHTVSVIVEDNSDNKGGKTQINNIKIVKSDDLILLSYKLSGTGLGKARVIIDSIDFAVYDLNFDSHTSSPAAEEN